MKKLFLAGVLSTGLFALPALPESTAHTYHHRRPAHPHRKTVERTAIGAAGGAAVGALVGGGKGAAIGAAAGGGTGFAYDRYKNHQANESR